jgi:hypothetical protein
MDTLSRRISAIYEIIMSKYDHDLKDKIKSTSIRDDEYTKIKEILLKSEEEQS